MIYRIALLLVTLWR